MQLLVGRISLMLGSWVITVVLARALGPAAYGLYGFAMALLVWLEVSGDFGIRAATTRLLAGARRASEIEQTSCALLAAGSLVLFLAAWVASPWIAASFHLETGGRVLRIALLDLPLNGLYSAYQGILLGSRRYGALALALFLYSVTKVAAVLSLLLVGMSVEGALIANVLATVGALAYLLTRHRVSPRFASAATVRRIVSVATPLAGAVVLTQLLLSTHLWILKRSPATEDQIGYYVAALNVANLAHLVPLVLTGVVLGSVARAFAFEDRDLASRYVRAASRFVLVTLAPICVLLWMHAEPLMVWVYSDAFAKGGAYLGPLLAALGLYAVFQTLMHCLIGAGKQLQVTATLLGLVPLGVFLNQALVARHSAQGAAESLLLTMAVATIVAVILSWRVFGPPLAWRSVVRVALGIGVTIPLGALLPATGPGLLLELVALLLVYLAVLAGLREIDARDLEPLLFWRRRHSQR